jgi:hypothetical protein
MNWSRMLYAEDVGGPGQAPTFLQKKKEREVINKVHRHVISVCYVSGTKRIGIKRIAA